MSSEEEQHYLPTVKKTIEIITRHRDAPPGSHLSMSTPSNATLPSSPSGAHISLLWLPYVLIVLVFIVFLGANFWCYHKKHRKRYLRKRDEKRVKEGLHERRRITALMRSHFQTHFLSKSVDSPMDSEGDFMDPKTEVTEVSCSVDAVTSPIMDQWTSQNGSCKPSDVCNLNSQTVRSAQL